tara:strand:- start:26 stop:445 length:420 start_codon:yes stop_codon:yes gene_type:complete
MAKGKEWTTEQKDTIIQSLGEYLEIGFSRAKACKLIGLAESTLSNWVKGDEALGMKLMGYENAINKLVYMNIVDAIRREGEMEDDLRKENTWKWADRKMKDDGMTTKVETDITTNGKELPTPILGINHVQSNNSSNEDK